MYLKRISTTFFILCVALSGVFAQDARMISAAGNQFVISAVAGGISAVEGEATVFRKEGRSERLIRSDSLMAGDRAVTGENGKVEVMLNPGSFIRLGPNTSFEFINTGLDQLLLKLNSGSAVLEVYAGDDFKVLVRTPSSFLDINRSGVFRIDALEDGTARMSVWKGSTLFGPSKYRLKTGYAVVVKGTNGAVSKFDRDEKDGLDNWSQLRGKAAAKANSKLQAKALGGSLLNSFNRGGWNMYRSFGVWVFDPRYGWSFLPFGSGWRSPYGYWYDFDIWNFRFPYYVYTNPGGGVGGGNGNGGGGGTGGGSGTGTGGGTGTGTGAVIPGGGRRTETKGDPNEREGGVIRDIPIYRRFENTQRTIPDSPVTRGWNPGGGFGGGAERGSGGGGWGGGSGGGVDNKPVFSSPVSQPSSSGGPPSPSRIISKDDN